MNKNLKVFKRYIYDNRVDYISFDNNSIGNYYHHLEKFKGYYTKFTQIINKIKTVDKDKKYDTTIIISENIDFSYII